MVKEMLLGMCLFVLSPVNTVVALTNNSLPELPTETFVKTNMMNSNGSIAARLQPVSSYSPSTVTGREALSESMGLWMQDMVLKNDQIEFQKAYQTLSTTFVDSTGFAYWKVEPDGSKIVSSDATLDDYRIIGALNQASLKWNNKTYDLMAQSISSSIAKNNIYNGYFTDFYDSTYRTPSHTVTLEYIDPEALKYMERSGIINSTSYSKNTNLLTGFSQDSIFYPKFYNVDSGKFTYDSNINMIDQLYVAYHEAELGNINFQFKNFLTNQFYTNHMIYGDYDLNTVQPTVSFDSPAVYALAIQYALKTGDNKFANDLFSKLSSMMNNDSSNAYFGGFVYNGDANVFNELSYLVAQRTLQSNLNPTLSTGVHRQIFIKRH